MKMPKVAIIGAGMVGGSTALLVQAYVPNSEIVIVDINRSRAEGQAYDIAHACALWGAAHVRAGGFQDVENADIIIVTAGVAMKPGETRLDLARNNVAILKDILSETKPRAPEAIYILAINPVDVLTYVSWKYLGLPRERVISTGTSLDSARLRSLLSDRLGLSTTAIHAHVFGEHGDSAFIHWSGASAGGLKIADFLTARGLEMSPQTKEMLNYAVHDAAHLIKEGKGVSHYGIGSSIAKIVQAVLHNTQVMLPVATVLPEVEGVPDVCLSIPHLIGRAGATVISYPQLDDEEKILMLKSATTLKQAQDEALLHL